MRKAEEELTELEAKLNENLRRNIEHILYEKAVRRTFITMHLHRSDLLVTHSELVTELLVANRPTNISLKRQIYKT